MNKLILTFAVGSLLLYSCGNSSNEKLNNQTEVAQHNDHHHDDESEAIELNNGEKWQVNANMITHIRNMENDVVSYAKVEQKDYKSLSEKLQSNIDLVKEFSEAKDETEASKHFENIQISFTTFNQYFQ